MGIFNLLKRKEVSRQKKTPEATEKKEKPTEVKKEIEQKERQIKETAEKSGKKIELKGKSSAAPRILIKPLVTEKAADLSSFSQYVFAVDSKANKIEVKKAIRAIYNVEPVKVNIVSVSGKKVRYGRLSGKTKNWKKAVVTLKPGDKIEIYEGV